MEGFQTDYPEKESSQTEDFLDKMTDEDDDKDDRIIKFKPKLH